VESAWNQTLRGSGLSFVTGGTPSQLGVLGPSPVLSEAHERSQRPVAAWHRGPRQIRDAAGFSLLGADVVAGSAVALIYRAWTIPVAILVLAIIALNSAGGYYRYRLTLSILDDLPQLLGHVLVGIGVAMTTASAIAPTEVLRTAWVGGVVGLAIIACRAVAYFVARLLRERGVLAHPTLILGAGRVGRQLAEAMLAHPEHGLHPVGFVDGDPLTPAGELPVPVVGGADQLAHLVESRRVDYLVIAFTSMREVDMVDVVRECDRLDCEILLVPRLFELTPRERDWEEVDGIAVARLRRGAFRSATWPLKRVIDVIASGLAILALSPLLLMLALGSRLVDGRGVIFRQERVGVDGKTFEMLKFRSLRPADEGESNTRWNVKDDDRMSWFGKFERRSSLDELPQLYNILRGDMSLVGPRPERPFFQANFDGLFPRYGARRRVPSGLTGWAQIHGLRGDTSIEERARFDNYYIENWSLWLDAKIVMRTFLSVVNGSG